MKKNTNTNAFKIFALLFILILSAVSATALSLLTEFDQGVSSKSIMPGTSTNYFVMGVADQGLDEMIVSAKFYDVTTGESELLGELFTYTTSETFFYPPAFSIKPGDFTDLPGSYVISVKAEEWLTNGVYRTTTSELDLDVIGNRLPVADFIYDPSNPSTITNVKLTSTSYDVDGFLVKYEWFVDSVKIGEGQTITYKFPTAGAHEVTLRVTDNEGGQASAKKTIIVTQGAQDIYPIADFIYSPSDPQTNQQITFTSTSTDADGSIIKEEWDFNNDGTYETSGHVVSKTFAQEGSYTVTLRVTDNSNLQSKVSKVVVVVKPTPVNIPPVADFTYTPANPLVDESIVFTSTSYDTDGQIVAYKWTIDGLPQGDTASIGVSFANPGTYTFTLTVTDNSGASASKTKQVVVKARPVNVPPVANFVYTPANPKVDESISLTSTSTDSDGFIVKEEWDFNNDGIFELPYESDFIGSQLAKSFSQPGNYPVSLRVTDNDGAKSTITKIIVVIKPAPVNVPPVADFTYTPNYNITACNQVVTFTSTSHDSDGTVVSQEWFVSGVSAGSSKTMQKTFSAAGTYTVMLIVTDNSGAQDSKSKQIIVNVCPPVNVPPVANFVYTPSNPKVNETITFTSTSSDADGIIVKEEWDFNNDGVFEQVQNTIGSEVYRYFSTPGNYVVALRVTDDDGAKATVSKVIVVVNPTPVNVPPVANFTYAPKNITAGQTVAFTSTSYDTDGYIVSYEWFVDGVLAGSANTMNRNFPNSGIYSVTLRVTDNSGAQDSETKQIIVYNANIVPVANFVYTPSNPIVNQTVTFTSTSYDTDGSIVLEEWDFNNDGTFEVTGHIASKLFSYAGSYTVTLRVTDNSGAKATVSKVIVVVNPTPVNVPPVANFVYTPGNPIVNQTVTFTSTSYDTDGSIVLEEWDFNNDGTFEVTGHIVNKVFTYAGSFVVTLRVTDNSGAKATVSKTIVVVNPTPVNVPPVANFVYTPSNPIVNEQVVFTSTSYDTDGTIVAYEWFVNGDLLSDTQMLYHVFSSAGTYTVMLRVTDDDGAKATVSKTIVVVNPTPVNVPPVADFTYTPSIPIVLEAIKFVSTSYDTDGVIVSYEWFVDGASVPSSSQTNPEIMYHSFSQVGTHVVTLRVMDDGGEYESISKNIVIGNAPCPPNAVLRIPESVTVNTLVKMDGALSTAGCDATITAYNWRIYKHDVLVNEVTTTVPYSSYTFTSNAEYRVVLTVYNSNNASDSDEKLVFAGRVKQGIVIGSEDDLYVDYFDVVGSDYGVISCTETFAISATVSNDRADNIQDLRVTFAIPELGYKIKSQAFDLKSGKTKTITFYGDLDMMKEEVIPGEYYAFIGASDTDTIRVKYFPLIIN